jgi:large subunit ribosomal protein L6
MSRIGKKPISIPTGVEVQISGSKIQVKGPKGTLNMVARPEIGVELKDGVISVAPVKQTKKSAALWGLTRTLVSNMIEGVSRGFSKKLEIQGIGYKGAVTGANLVLNVGFSHPVNFPAPQGITFLVEKNVITVSGFDKELVGQTAAKIRSIKKPEPYKGKGIRYQGEYVRQKAGKKSVAGA